jgi:hypothetical protein
MKRLVSNMTTAKLLIWAVIASILFLIAKIFIPNPPLINLLNGIFFGVSVAVAIVYSPLIRYSLTYNKFDRVSQLSIGIGLIWVSMAFQRLWAGYNRFFGSPLNAANSTETALIVYIAILGGILFVSAPGYADTQPPVFGGENRKLLLIFGMLGGLATSIMYFLLDPHF